MSGEEEWGHPGSLYLHHSVCLRAAPLDKMPPSSTEIEVLVTKSLFLSSFPLMFQTLGQRAIWQVWCLMCLYRLAYYYKLRFIKYSLRKNYSLKYQSEGARLLWGKDLNIPVSWSSTISSCLPHLPALMTLCMPSATPPHTHLVHCWQYLRKGNSSWRTGTIKCSRHTSNSCHLFLQ